MLTAFHTENFRTVREVEIMEYNSPDDHAKVRAVRGKKKNMVYMVRVELLRFWQWNAE